MGNEVQVSQIEEIIKVVQNIGDYFIPITTSEMTNVMWEPLLKNQCNLN